MKSKEVVPRFASTVSEPIARGRDALPTATRALRWSFWFVAAGVLALVVAPLPVAAEVDNDLGLWLVLLGQGSAAPIDARLGKLRWWFDGQARFLDESNGFAQSLIRPGIGYALTDRVTAWGGYAWIRSTPGAGRNSEEHRGWQQVTWSTRLDSLAIGSRTRLEQRFVDTGHDTGWRLRQFVKLTHPLPLHPRLGLAGYDEAFFDLNDTDWGADTGFAQNRLFAGFSWRLDGAGKIVAECGYLNQFIRNPSRADPMNHILSLHLLLSY